MRRKWHFSQWKAPVNQHVAHAQLIATYKRAQADAAHKQGLIKAVAAKGPKAIQAAVDTAAKAAKRRMDMRKSSPSWGWLSRIERGLG